MSKNDNKSFRFGAGAAQSDQAAVHQQESHQNPDSSHCCVPLREWIGVEHRLLDKNRQLHYDSLEELATCRRVWLKDSTRLSLEIALALQTCVKSVNDQDSFSCGMDDIFIERASVPKEECFSNDPHSRKEPGDESGGRRLTVFVRVCPLDGANLGNRGEAPCVHATQLTSESYQHQKQQTEFQKSALFFLGAVIYEIFAGIQPGIGQTFMLNKGTGASNLSRNSRTNLSNDALASADNRNCEGNPPNKRTSRRQTPARDHANDSTMKCKYLLLTEFGLPSCIATIVSCLLDQTKESLTGTLVYEQIPDLIGDLLVIINDPTTFLFDLSSSLAKTLLLSSRLSGLPSPRGL
mmetsp:Transcript_13968/g.40891  ORF Transcript_13968/g.40891 Transcript_13968/m.40891 type:complete len:351 (+) Transcript_13968:347-1399(+)